MFNLLSKLNVPAENYPFCTIDPSYAHVPVPDPRFDRLCQIYKPKREISALLTVHDIAGLVRGASEGAGLGNQFLSHIQAVDAIYHLCRAFPDVDIQHVETTVDPVRDLQIISEELIAKDLATVLTKYETVAKIIQRGIDKSKQKQREFETLKKAKECLEAGTDIREYPWSNDDVETLNQLQLLTAKPVVYLVNMGKDEFTEPTKNEHWAQILEWCAKRSPDAKVIPFSVKHEQEVLESKEEEKDRKTHDANSKMGEIILAGYHALNLIHYFTCGADEVRAWTIKRGTLAPAAAGVIHSDFQRCFVMAEVFHYDDLIQYGSEAEVKKAGKLAQRGKDYEFRDGDIAFFKHTAGGAGKK